MWYAVFSTHRYKNKLPFSYNIAYAESKDGLVWTRPRLGVFDAKEEDPGNSFIRLGVHKTQDIDVQINPLPGRLPGRFIAVHNDRGGVFVSTSDDGKLFTLLTNNPAIAYHSDTHNNLVYDEVRDRWLLYCRARAYAGDHKRRVSVAISPDLVNWTHERTILIPGEAELPEYYGLTVFRRGDVFFGMLQVYDRVKGFMHGEFVWSADGVRWEQITTHPIVLARGPEGAWDHGMVAAAESPVVVGDKMRFYYGGWAGSHDVISKGAVGMATAERDRLVGLRPKPGQTGYALTRPLPRPATGDLTLNATIDGEKGSVRVEIRNDLGEPIPGFTADDCDVLTTSGFEKVLRWKGGSISKAPVGDIRLRFEVRDATLYTYDLSTRK